LQRITLSLALPVLICYFSATKRKLFSYSGKDQELAKSSSASGAGNIVLGRYAAALIDVAAKAGVLEAVQKDMASLEASLLNSAEFLSFVESPVHGAIRQKAAVQEVAKAARFQQVTSNFLCVLAGNRRLYSLKSIISAFHREIAKRMGQVDAFVKAAHPLTAEQEKNLAQMLATKTGKTVRLFVEVDQELLGGMIITVGSQMIDDSVKSKLSRMKNSMISNSNQNASLKEVG
jgi:F-type H+-transporting ATPase subunit delta